MKCVYNIITNEQAYSTIAHSWELKFKMFENFIKMCKLNKQNIFLTRQKKNNAFSTKIISIFFRSLLLEPEKSGTGQIDMNSLDLQSQKLCKALILAICYSANIGGISTLTGTTPNLVVKGYLDQYVLT